MPASHPAEAPKETIPTWFHFSPGFLPLAFWIRGPPESPWSGPHQHCNLNFMSYIAGSLAALSVDADNSIPNNAIYIIAGFVGDDREIQNLSQDIRDSSSIV